MLEKDVTNVPALPKIKQWLSQPGCSQGWLSEQLGVSRPTVYRWVTGEHAPDAHYRRAIYDLSKHAVHFDDWYTDEQLKMAYRFSHTRKRRLASRAAQRKDQ